MKFTILVLQSHSTKIVKTVTNNDIYPSIELIIFGTSQENSQSLKINRKYGIVICLLLLAFPISGRHSGSPVARFISFVFCTVTITTRISSLSKWGSSLRFFFFLLYIQLWTQLSVCRRIISPASGYGRTISALFPSTRDLTVRIHLKA